MDDREAEAIDIVAHDLIAWVVREHAATAAIQIAERVWERIAERAVELAPQVDGESYAAAVDYLLEHRY